MPNGANDFLQRLPKRERDRVLEHSKPVDLPRATVLDAPHQPARFAYLLSAGLSSTVSISEEGRTTEVGVVGCEGLVNAALLLGNARPATESIMQVEGAGLQIPLQRLRSLFEESAHFRGSVLQLIQAESFAALTVAGCYRYHTLEQRLARWLLLVRDRIDADEFEMTQEFLGLILGTSRPYVVTTLRKLRERGLLENQRERIRLLDRPGLEKTACSCYGVVRRLYAEVSS